MITSIVIAVAVGFGTIYSFALFADLLTWLAERLTPVGPPTRSADTGSDLPRKDEPR
jgi:hypothetical protein